AERVAGAERDLGAAGGERPREDSGLRRHMKTRREPESLERLLLLEATPDLREHGHLPIGPLDAELSLRRQRAIRVISLAHAPASFFSAAAMLVFSQVNSASVRPKWPKDAVLR